MKASTSVILSTLFFTSLLSAAQDEGFIYGKIHLIDDKTYEGPIRWGKEEVYWTDIFNTGKESNDNLRYLSSDDRERLEDRRFRSTHWSGSDDSWRRWIGWDWDYRDRDEHYTHQFACQFGEIKTITPSGRKYADLVMQNGNKFSVSGEGYNDIGPDIRVMDPEMGSVNIEWERIRKIEFQKTPKTLEQRFGKPLFGTVEAFGEKYTGYIQWDHDERLDTDKLDGDADEGTLSIEFGKIRSITRSGWRSNVVLKSGRELKMEGSNDVNNENRGIIVMGKGFVAIDIPWDEFEKITFEDKGPEPAATYEMFASQKELNGTVTTMDGKTMTGKIIFDLDEEFGYELLQGNKDDVEFSIPFRDIKKIQPLTSHRCEIEMRNGQKITLEDAQDVDDRNQGVLIFSGKADPEYVSWDKVQTIAFN